jgi:lambda repressor-like predicted transcriptional regulator
MATISLGGKIEAALEKEGTSFGAPATAMARAILDTVVREGIVQDILAGVQVEEFVRGRGRPRTKRAAPHGIREPKYTFNGRPAKLEELSAIAGVPQTTIRNRISRGVPVEQAIIMKNQNFKANRGEREEC